MKKISSITLLSLILLSPSLLHAQSTEAAFHLSQSVSSEPNAEGQYTATIEAFVDGSNKSDNTEIPLDITLLVDLSTVETTETFNTTSYQNLASISTGITNITESDFKKTTHTWVNYWGGEDDVSADLYQLNNVTYNSSTCYLAYSSRSGGNPQWELCTKNGSSYNQVNYGTFTKEYTFNKGNFQSTSHTFPEDKVRSKSLNVLNDIKSDYQTNTTTKSHYVRILGYGGSNTSSGSICSFTNISSYSTISPAISSISVNSPSICSTLSDAITYAKNNTRSGSSNNQVVVIITKNSGSKSASGTYTQYQLSYDNDDIPSDFPPSSTSQSSYSADYALMGSASSLTFNIADGFVIPSNWTTSKTINNVVCTGVGSDNVTRLFAPSGNTETNATVTVDESGKSVSITGFDFSGKSCGKDASGNANGQKLVVTIPVVTSLDKSGDGASTVFSTPSVKNQSNTPLSAYTSSDTNNEVVLQDIVINVAGSDIRSNENFLFSVSGKTASETWNKTFTVMVNGASSITLKALPAGTYTIAPKSWPWTYGTPTPSATYSNTSLNGADLSATYTFTLRSDINPLPHHGEAAAAVSDNE